MNFHLSCKRNAHENEKKHTCNISYLWNESECFSLANFINLLKSSGSKSRLDAEGNEITQCSNNLWKNK